ncbi:MAG: ferrochelatase [Rhodothermia bacterium]|nr:ferrochelatase [Rhodothermia bacterium]
MSNFTEQISLYQKHGAVFPVRPIDVASGRRVAVVLLSLGEPRSTEEVEDFLVNSRYVGVMSPFGRFFYKLRIRKELRNWLLGLEAMGGGAAYSRIRRDLRFMLEEHLNHQEHLAQKHLFSVFIANSYGDSSHEAVTSKIKEMGIEHVILIPMYPHFSQATTGVVLAHFQKAIEAVNAQFKVSLVHEYARHPQYVQALSDRIMEGLSRFPKHIREDVELVFAAFGCRTANHLPNDPALVLIEETISALLSQNRLENEWHLSCMSEVLSGSKKYGLMGVKQVVSELADQGKRAVLVIPISFITERFEVSYFLDTVLRSYALERGIQFEVSYSPQGNPLLLEALGDMVVRKITTLEKQKSFYRPDEWVLRQQDGKTIWVQSWVKSKPTITPLRQTG